MKNAIVTVAVLAMLAACGGGAGGNGGEKAPELDQCANALVSLTGASMEFLNSPPVGESLFHNDIGKLMVFSNGESRTSTTYVQYGACQFDGNGKMVSVTGANGVTVTP
jgi:hypothetical protein